MDKTCKYLLVLLMALMAPVVVSAADNEMVPVADYPADTLLCAASAGNISIIYNSMSTTVTVSNVNDTDDNFYFQSGKKKNSDMQTSINCTDITAITIVENMSALIVDFTTSGGEKQSYTFAFEDPANRSFTSYIGRRGSDFGFTISKSGNGTVWDCVSAGFGFGWIGAINDIPAMGTSMWRSNELTWLMVLGVQMTHGHHTVSMGLGLDWQNFVTKGNHYFHYNTDGRITLEQYDEGVTDTRSRIKIFSLQVPLLYRLNFGRRNCMGIQIGPVVNFNTGSSIKTQYKHEGREYTVKTNSIGQRPVTVDGLLSVNYRAVGIYLRYSPMSKLRSAAGLDFGSVSTGIMLGF